MIASREYVKSLLSKILSKFLYYKNPDTGVEGTFKFGIDDEGNYGYIKDDKVFKF